MFNSQLPELIDTHCHLNYDYSPKSVGDIVREAHLAGISKLVTIGTDLPTLEAVQAISDQYENVYHTVGVHPHEAKDLPQDQISLIAKKALHRKCVGIGEIGLDYHYNHSDTATQLQALDWQLELALSLNKPIVIHSREGESDLLPRLSQYAARVSKERSPGVIHCFTGSRAFGEACIDLGFYISFSGILTFKKAADLQECATHFPLSRLVVETDAPFLAPVPHRGAKCEPQMVRLTALKISELKNLSIEEVARVTTENAKNLFQF